jgi:hypothetical protein
MTKAERTLAWEIARRIQRKRFRKLIQAIKFNLVAAVIVLFSLFIIPAWLGVSFFTGHYILGPVIAIVVAGIAGRFYWMSFKTALQ